MFHHTLERSIFHVVCYRMITCQRRCRRPETRKRTAKEEGVTNGQTVHRSSSFSPESHQCTMHNDQDSPVLRERLPTQSKLQLMYRAPCNGQRELRSSCSSPFELSLESSIHNDIKQSFHDLAATSRAAFREVQTARGSQHLRFAGFCLKLLFGPP
jgi:hypothetical protein